jgi:hypothetical protein
MHLLSRLDDGRTSGAIWYAISRQSPQIQALIGEACRRVQLRKQSVHTPFIADGGRQPAADAAAAQ